jgi:hypothetical protein
MVYCIDHYEGKRTNKIRNKANYNISFRQAEQNAVTNPRSSVRNLDLIKPDLNVSYDMVKNKNSAKTPGTWILKPRTR